MGKITDAPDSAYLLSHLISNIVPRLCARSSDTELEQFTPIDCCDNAHWRKGWTSEDGKKRDNSRACEETGQPHGCLCEVVAADCSCKWNALQLRRSCVNATWSDGEYLE